MLLKGEPEIKKQLGRKGLREEAGQEMLVKQ